MLLRLAICAVVMATSLAAGAQLVARSPSDGKTVQIQKIPAKIHVDGKLDEPVWSTLTPITGFIQTDPDLGAPVSEKTEALIFYDDQNIYFGFRCYDSEAEKIVHRYGAHDAVTGSDSVDILIDTFHDRRTGYYFSINSRGIQFDAITNEAGGASGFDIHDPSWDGIWYSAAALEPWGWSAEVVIPFKSIRLVHAPEQVWGLNLAREIVRKNERAYWVAVTRYDDTMKPSKAGTLSGLENVHVGRNLELIPYASTKYRNSPWIPRFQGFNGAGGLDARYGIAQNLTANLAINPDFGETEADEFTAQISRFEIFFPEKRKFFTEGANYFATPLNLFFTRRVGARLADGEPQRILEGGKLTGRVGNWTVGALEALTQHTGFTDPETGLPQISPAAFFGVLRLQHDLFQKSAIGLISVNRVQKGVLLDSDGNVVSQRESTNGVDLTVLSGQHVRWSSQLAANLNSGHPGFGAQHLGGISTFRYDSEKFAFGTGGKFLGRNFDIRSTGFEPEVDRWTGWMTVDYKPFINRWGMRQIFAELNYDESNGSGGELEDAGADADLRVQFKNFWNFRARYSYDRVRFNQFTPAFTRLGPTRVYVTPSWQFTLSTNDRRPVYLTFLYLTSGLVQFDENFFGYQKQYQATANIRLGDHLRWELNGIHVSEAQRSRTHFQDRRFLISRWTYQFTPKLRTRVLAQYESDHHGHNLSINSLLAYDFTARSALFVGYNRQRHSPLDPADLGNQVFVKLSYLFSF